MKPELTAEKALEIAQNATQKVDEKVDALTPVPPHQAGIITGGCRFNAITAISGELYWGNVALVEYLDVGKYQVTFASAESDEFYQVQVTCGDASDDGEVYVGAIPKKFQEAGGFKVHVFGISARTFSDPDNIMVQIVRFS
jgi:hypothetical protein